MSHETLLALDVGNTQTVVGLFEAERLMHKWRLATVASRTMDEFRISIQQLLSDAGASFRDLDAIVISSVVPRVTENLMELGKHATLLLIDHSLHYDFSLKLPLPEQLGADRLVNAQAAIRRYGAPLIIVDCGTATTFCAINSRREYLGGAIAPGIQISTAALLDRASRLGGVSLVVPDRVIGNTTDGAIRSGVVHGHAAFIDGMVDRISAELNEEGTTVVGTGGYFDLLAPVVNRVDHVVPGLTLEGLRIIYESNRDRARNST